MGDGGQGGNTVREWGPTKGESQNRYNREGSEDLHAILIQLCSELLGEGSINGIDGQEVAEEVTIDRSVHTSLELDGGEDARPPLVET